MFKKYRTGELLKYLGVLRDTLRFYEEKGLLNPEKNDENNYRSYSVF
ncbi:MerR family transcriptional regulator [Pseudobacteroides cellulosolvens]|nr:MerR family transcriptional regulator [Pseudobacteroides cellulosolvens]